MIDCPANGSAGQKLICLHAAEASCDTLCELPRAKHGIEKECLRVTADATPSPKPHPRALGSSLLHPFITTDFTEPQLELTTAPFDSIPEVLENLADLQAFTIDRIDGELLWPLSMPSRLPKDDEAIVLATYGDSPLGRKKTIYRRGLGYRYGRRIQTISGVHFNFSFKETLFSCFGRQIRHRDSASELYCHVARNLKRKIFYFTYLFGASPACDASFVNGPVPCFERHGQRTLFARHATSLRQSEIGYTSAVQGLLPIDFNSKDGYVRSLEQAVSTVNPDYEEFSRIPLAQLNPNYLQIENELYVPVRLKQTPHLEETLTRALARRGIGYLEMRSIDIDPYSPTGVDSATLGFLHLAFIDALLSDSPPLTPREEMELRYNQSAVSWQGRREDLRVAESGTNRLFRELGKRYGDRLYPLARVLDRNTGTDFYESSIEEQQGKWEAPERTPSGRVLSDLLDHGREHIGLGLELAERHARALRERGLGEACRMALEREAERSIRAQRALDLGCSCG